MKRSKRLVACAPAALGLLLIACSSVEEQPSVSATASATTSGTGGAGGTEGPGGTGGGNASTGSSGGGSYVAPPVSPACAAPTITQGSTWATASGHHAASLRLAWSGQDAALAYAESTAPGSWDIKLQRLTSAGTVEGNPTTLGGSGAQYAPAVTVASDGAAYVTCWEGAAGGGSIACVRLTSSGSSAPALSVAGRSPSVAFGPGGWGIVYAAGNQIVSQHLDDLGNAVGTAHEVASTSSAEISNPKLTATSTGYAALETAWAGILWRFDAQFEEEEGNTVSGWPDGPFDVAGSGETVGTLWLASGTPTFGAVDPSNRRSTPAKVDAQGAGSVYSNIALARGTDSFAAVWSAFEGYIGYRAIDGSGMPAGDVVTAMNVGWDDNPVAAAGVADGFLVGAAAGISLDSIAIVHLGCP